MHIPLQPTVVLHMRLTRQARTAGDSVQPLCCFIYLLWQRTECNFLQRGRPRGRGLGVGCKGTSKAPESYQELEYCQRCVPTHQSSLTLWCTRTSAFAVHTGKNVSVCLRRVKIPRPFQRLRHLQPEHSEQPLGALQLEEEVTVYLCCHPTSQAQTPSCCPPSVRSVQPAG